LAAIHRHWYLSGALIASPARMVQPPITSHPVPDVDLAPLTSLLHRAFPATRGQRVEWTAMPGGASTRRYFRTRLGDVAAVGMFVPDGLKADEVQSGGVRARWPFLEVRDLLEASGIDVPAIYGEDTARGWALLEDLGDGTLAEVLAAHPARRQELYTRAASDVALAQMQLAALPGGCVVASRTFDLDLLLWEMKHFREWALDARGIVLTERDAERFDAIARSLAARIASWPRTFVHRDYQSRNLMVRPDGRLCWIDFQDALLGPRVYDLVALLNDSYQTFDRPFVEARLADYARTAGLGESGLAELRREFDLVTVQRKLKDAGRFVFIDRVKQNSSFLRFVEPTIAKVRASLARLEDDDDMRELAAILARTLGT
jgi:aminoglycoside/choline kinase family phosphotransferase